MARAIPHDLEHHMQNHERPIHVLTEIESAQLVAKIAHGLLTGPCAVAFMRQTALGQGAELMAKDLMGVAESLAMESIKRGFALSSFSYKLASEEHMKRTQDAEDLKGIFTQGQAQLGGKDTLVQELYNGREPEDSIETEDGAWYGRYPLEDGDLVGAILYEDTDGGISGTFFEDADELAEAWDELGEEDEDEEDADV